MLLYKLFTAPLIRNPGSAHVGLVRHWTEQMVWFVRVVLVLVFLFFLYCGVCFLVVSAVLLLRVFDLKKTKDEIVLIRRAKCGPGMVLLLLV